MPCLIALMAWAMPRFTLFLMFVFGYDNMERAMNSFLMGFFGFLLLPYTTVIYIICYAPIGGVSGLGWFFVALGFILDLASHLGGGKQGQTYYVERRAT